MKTNFEVLTSINVIKSSLLPTANVVPSGDQAKLMFSPEKEHSIYEIILSYFSPFVSIVVLDRSVLVSNILTNRSPLAVAT
jgi:hypothetical protein